MALVVGVSGFVVRPPHLALCTIMRLLTSNCAGQTFQPNDDLSTELTSFLILQVFEDDVHFPSLSGLLSQLRDELGEDEVAVGNFCRETLSGLCSVSSLTCFIDSLKRDLEGKNGSSNIIRRILPPSGPTKCSRYGLFGTFFRKCIKGFEEMRFEQICNLAREMEEYCPSMLDQDPKSVYLRDHEQLESRIDKLIKEVQKGQIPDSLEQDLKDLGPVSEFFPKLALVQHEVSVLEREVTTAFDYLRQYCNRSMHSGSSFTVSGNPSTSTPANNVHSLMLRMASTHFHFDHIETSVSLVEEAYESAKTCNDDGILQSCLVVLLQNLIQTSPSILHSAKLPVGKKERFQFIDQCLRRCEQKAIELKTPHILAFCQICRSTLGVKNHLIGNQLASPDEICRMTGIGVQNLTRLRSFVSAGSLASDLKTYTNDEDTPGVLQSLFNSASEIFGPTVKDTVESTETSVQQSLASGVLLNSLAWKAKGSVALSEVLALSVEAVYSDDCKVSDRAAALAHLAIMEANSKGVEQGMNILEYAKKDSNLANEISIKMAEEYIQLGKHLWTAPTGRLYDEIQQRLEALASVSNQSSVTCLEAQFMGEIQRVRALLTLNKIDEAREETTHLMQLQEVLGMEVAKSEIDLLHLDIQNQLGIPDLKITEYLQDLSETQNNPMAVVLFCRTLMKLEDKSNDLITRLLKSVYPRVLAEGSIVFETAFLLFYIDFLLTDSELPSSQNKIKVLVTLIKHGVDLSAQLKNLYLLKKFLGKNEQLQKKHSDQRLKEETISELASICRRNGMRRTEIQQVMRMKAGDDAMDLD